MVEPDETFTVGLTAPTNTTIADGVGVGTITDDDTAGALPTVSICDTSVVEGNSATRPATFTVSLSAASAQPVSVRYERERHRGGTRRLHREGLDLLTFQPGQTSKPVTVTVTGDAVVEPDETFTVNLAIPANAAIADGLGVGTITDDDTAGGPPTISISDASVTGGNAGTRPAAFTITLSAPSTQPVTVRYATSNGTAVASGDYAAKASALVTFQPGQTSEVVNVQVKGEAVVEPNETFPVTLSTSAGATIADGSGAGTIVNDD